MVIVMLTNALLEHTNSLLIPHDATLRDIKHIHAQLLVLQHVEVHPLHARPPWLPSFATLALAGFLPSTMTQIPRN